MVKIHVDGQRASCIFFVYSMQAFLKSKLMLHRPDRRDIVLDLVRQPQTPLTVVVAVTFRGQLKNDSQ